MLKVEKEGAGKPAASFRIWTRKCQEFCVFRAVVDERSSCVKQLLITF
jgi:hypothetical protein